MLEYVEATGDEDDIRIRPRADISAARAMGSIFATLPLLSWIGSHAVWIGRKHT